MLSKLLIERGADFTVEDNSGSTALHLAQSMGHDDVVFVLKSAEASTPKVKITITKKSNLKRPQV